MYVYFPHRNSTVVSAQVVWDRLTILEAGGAVDKYSVNVNDINGPISVRVIVIVHIMPILILF